jgi:hypothetical protein
LITSNNNHDKLASQNSFWKKKQQREIEYY